jgi:DNA-binding NtrC family response regulator
MTTQIGKILVVDDEVELKNILVESLTSQGYETSGLASGEKALAALRADPFDVVLTDLMMPGMDGLTLIRQVKRIKADLPVIIITGFSTESSAIEAVNLGVAGYLTKPFRVPQVLAAAAKALGAPAA